MIPFTIREDGKVSMENVTFAGISKDITGGEAAYTVSLINGRMKNISFKKVDIADKNKTLAGAQFDLYKIGTDETSPVLLVEDLISDSSGMLNKNGQTVFELPTGTYHLIETKAPAGYLLKTDPVVITIDKDTVTYNDNTALSGSNSGVLTDSETGTVTLLITNSAGIELPSTGGVGTGIFRIGGTLLIAAALILRNARKVCKQKKIA